MDDCKREAWASALVCAMMVLTIVVVAVIRLAGA